MKTIRFTAVFLLFIGIWVQSPAYPIDGFLISGIRRLVQLQLILKGEMKGTQPISGAQKSIDDIQLNLTDKDRWDESLADVMPEPDPDLQKAINALFPNLNQSYSISLVDITPGKPVRYAYRKEKRGFQPGSVGKLAVITGFFTELQKIYPNSFQKRRELMRTRFVKSGKWGLYDQHTVPFFDPETEQFVKRRVQAEDVFSLYEWTDHMLSVSNNGAASIVWREAILMRVFGYDYLTLTDSAAEEYFTTTPKTELSDTAMAVVNEPLREICISKDEWRLGRLFTSGAGSYIPGKGGSIGTPLGLMKFLVSLERGLVVDDSSSLEIKRLMYMTDRRIRYAASSVLNEAAVYFKSGSLYQCRKEEGFQCGKYRGNVNNYMNSVAIVEHPDSTTYMVALMTNVLRKNSSYDHYALASRIDKIIRQE